MNGIFTVPFPKNEPVYSYMPGTREKAELKKELERQSGTVVDIPVIIDGKEYFTEKTKQVVMPHNHKHVLANLSVATSELLELAVKTAAKSKKSWAETPWEHRAAIFLKAAELLRHKYRYVINAATMLGQSKNPYQAEIDSACELTDFLTFNAYFADCLYREQPLSGDGVWNRLQYRPLDGFVAAITPFNFTSIGGNLPTAPAIMGNTVLWKPGTTAALSNYYFYKLLLEAGLPEGVISFLPCNGSDMSKHVLSHPDMAGFHFTGSTAVFNGIWKLVGENIEGYRNYPRLVGETGGKDFVFAHSSADVKSLVTALARGAYEYQGQKCSAASRAYIPASIWKEAKEGLLKEIADIKMGDITDFRNLMGAVIDKASYDNIVGHIKYAEQSGDADVLTTRYDDSTGYFVAPTLIEAKTPDFKCLVEEIFGPVLTVFVYDDSELDKALGYCDKASVYGLTGSVFARDRQAIVKIENALSQTAGNFYINDKPTGAVVGQQPFGGARKSGTNDKAGSMLNLMRWVSPRCIKETFLPAIDVGYPYMSEE